MTPEDIRRIVVVEELDLSTDGRLAVVVRRSIKGDRYHGHLFAIDLERRDVPRPRQLTRGAVRDTGPRLCSDGRTVAFVRTIPTDEDTPARIALLDLERPGHPVRFVKTGDHGAVVELAWSPDGRRLAFTAEVDPPRFIVGPTTPVGRRRRPEREGRRDTLATGAAHHPGRLALGRRGSSRSMDAPVRRRLGRRDDRVR